jgi:Domain of unknown function (DUF4331)
MNLLRKFSALLALSLFVAPTFASSHREAPFITQQPKLDGTDFYMFNSYETGRNGFVTIVANYLPLQDAYGGPNYFTLDPKARYDINIDNNGDAKPDISFRFRFTTTNQDVALTIGGQSISIPLFNFAPTTTTSSGLNVNESYKLNVVRGTTVQAVTNVATNSATFTKPADNIGNESFPSYNTYARQFIYSVNIPGCSTPGRLFVGQRKDPFVVNLGEIFDLVNLNPLGANNARPNTIDDKNVTSLILEVAASCLTAGSDPVIGAWTTASAPAIRVLNPSPTFLQPASETGPFVQQSRLGNPLVNEVVIGLKDKNAFNASQPENDARFGKYVTNPTLPALLQLLFGVKAPTTFPRADLVQIFLTGVPGLNKPAGTVTPSEQMRLNTSIAAKPANLQNPLGVIGGDTAGYPNGRRPGDDVVDISLRAVMGVLLPASAAPDGQRAYTDGAFVNASFFDQTFPYIKAPLPGSPATP